MADTVDVKTLQDSKEAIKHGLTPFGRKLGIVMDDPNGFSLYRIKYMDDKQGGIPDELNGRWTSLAQCKNDLTGYLHRLWAFSDAQKAKLAKPLASTSTSAKAESNKISTESKS